MATMHSTTGSSTLRRMSLGGASLLLALGLAACGSDEDPGGESTEAGGTSAESGGGDVAAFCEAVVGVEALFGSGPAVDFETATPEEIQAALEEFGAEIEPVLAQVEETAPEEIAEDAATAAGLAREAAGSGDQSVLESEEFLSADAAIDEYMLAECGYEQLEATGVDYEYEGIPDTVTSGTVAVTFHNEGEELHEIGLVRINDGVDLSIEELLALPEEEAMSQVTFTGVAFAGPGESSTTFLSMEPGRYAAVCFVPEGTTHEHEGEGPPHFTLGMVAEFTAE
jgi:hypothetical protein